MIFYTLTVTMRKFFIFCCLIIAVLIQKSLADSKELLSNSTTLYTFVLLGASGDLSKYQIYPSLWYLYKHNLLPPKTKICGYSPTLITVDDLRTVITPIVNLQPQEEELYNKFWKINYYISGSNNSDADYDKINSQIEEWEEDGGGNRIFYMAIPPFVFSSAASQIKRVCMAKKGATRIVIEKPFGRDSASSKKLSDHFKSLFTEDQIYHMDHFLGIEMNQNLLVLRFANQILEATLNRQYIASIKVELKENFGINGRGGYFDKYGMIRDVVQNHLLQIISLIAMEKPRSINFKDIRDSKVELLKKVKPIVMSDVVIGQYVGNPESDDLRERIGYTNDPTVPKDSIASTFSLTVLKINNERWSGVPFIIRTGKGLNENKTDIVIQYKNITNDIFNEESKRNEVCMKLYNEKIEMTIMSKNPGISNKIDEIKLDFKYSDKYSNIDVPEAYSRLLLEIFAGSQKYFVRTDELEEAWRIFTPILHQIENENIRPILYKFGTNGPREADEIQRKNDFL